MDTNVFYSSEEASQKNFYNRFNKCILTGVLNHPKGYLLIVVSGLKIFSKCVNFWPYSCTSAQYLPVKEAHFKGMLRNQHVRLQL